MERRPAQAAPSTGEDRTGEDRTATEAAGAGGRQALPEPAAAPPLKSWEEMRDWAAHLLRSRTGQDIATWNYRAAEVGLPDEQALRAWLDGQGVTGYAQALLVWERFGYPDFRTAEADELIAGQYSDRPQLRPVLDAVLAALPALGPVTVQARKTCVSLVTPRCTFAVVQATTKSRVDLGLRLEHERPGGRLLAARDIGAATVRIPLTRPEDVDAEVLGWLRYVRGDRADRHLGLAWGDVHSDGTLRLFRGSKLRLAGVDPRLVEEAMRPGHRLVARIRLTGTRGEPALTWSAGPADADLAGAPLK